MSDAGAVADYLAALAANDWDALARTLTRGEFERVGPFADVVADTAAYLTFLANVVPKMTNYRVPIRRITHAGHVVVAEINEVFELGGRPMDVPEALVFDLDERPDPADSGLLDAARRAADSAGRSRRLALIAFFTPKRRVAPLDHLPMNREDLSVSSGLASATHTMRDKGLHVRLSVSLVGFALLAVACGTRVSHEDVVVAAGMVGAVQGTDTPGVDAGAVAGAEGTGASTGAAQPGPAAAGGESVSGQTTARSGAAAAPGAAGAPQKPTLSPIIIGSVGTYSGPPGATLAAGPQALRIWARYVNDRGGIRGHPVQVVVADDRREAADHRAAVKDLVENRHVVAFVAQIAPFTLDAAKDYLEQKRVPVMGGECSHLAWNQSPMFFPQCAEFRNGVWGTLQVALKFGKGKRFGLLTCVEAPACTDIKRFYWDQDWVTKAGLVKAYRSDISIAQPDFTAECLGARDQGVDVFSVVADVNTVVRVADSCARQDFFPQYMQGGGTTDWRIVSKKAFDGTLVKVNVFPHWDIGDTPATKEFLEAFRLYAPGLKPTANSALGWSAAKLFEKVARGAAAKAGSKPLTSAMFLEELWSFRNETLGGLVTPLTFRRNKTPVAGTCWFMMQIRRGTFTAPTDTRPMCGTAPS